MTLVSSIITDAYREGNILPLRKVPDAFQVAEALRLYNGNIRSIYGDDAGEGLTDWPLGTFNYESPNYGPYPYTDYQINHPTINRRLIVTNTEAKTIWLTPFPQDGARMAIADPFGRLSTVPVTLDANGRTIEGSPTLLLNVDGTFREWFYRADLGQWVAISGLTEGNENPFPDDFDNFFIIGLALRLNPRYGREIDEQSVMVFKSERRKFVARYLQSQPLEIDDSLSWPFMSTQSYDQQRAFSSNWAFNRGWYGGP